MSDSKSKSNTTAGAGVSARRDVPYPLFDTVSEREDFISGLMGLIEGSKVFQPQVEPPCPVDILPDWFTTLWLRLDMTVVGEGEDGLYYTNHDWIPGQGGHQYRGDTAYVSRCSLLPPAGESVRVFNQRQDEVVFTGCLYLHEGVDGSVRKYETSRGTFTARELCLIIAHHEKVSRTTFRDMFDGPNTHHIYFEGMVPEPGGTYRGAPVTAYRLQWGS